MSDYQPQTPSMSLLEICDVLWTKGEYQAYRALRAYIKERDELIKRVAQLERHANEA